MEVFLDSSLLIACVQLRLRLGELRALGALKTFSKVVEELERIAKARSARARAAALALELLKFEGIEVVPTELPADLALLKAARAGAAIATLDAKLKAAAKAAGAKVITIRKKKMFALA